MSALPIAEQGPKQQVRQVQQHKAHRQYLAVNRMHQRDVNRHQPCPAQSRVNAGRGQLQIDWSRVIDLTVI
ncbi:hypothetical protein EAM_0108 [Erwinia amylovora ATCC 49946]|nr:hypothetical protein EAM_0108 [Erwinia amylovora ATCC 49946]